MSARSHWATRYIGIPYKDGGRNRQEGVDCWGLIYLAYQECKQIQLPLIPGPSGAKPSVIAARFNEHIGDWVEIEEPFEGCMVGMGFKKIIHHIGMWVAADGGKVLHCLPQIGVVAEPMRNLSLRGFRTIRYFSYYGVDHRDTQCVSASGRLEKAPSPWGDHNPWLVSGI